MRVPNAHTRRRLLAAVGAATSVTTAGCLRLVGSGGDATVTDDGTESLDPGEGIERTSDRLAVALEPDAIGSRALVGSCRRGGQEVLDGAVTFNAFTPGAERIEHAETLSGSLTAEPPGYRLSRLFTAGSDTRLRIDHTVALAADRPVLTIETEMTNDGDQPVTIDRPDNHVHDGIILTRLPKLADVSGPYRYYVSGNNVYSAGESEYWQEHFVESDRPFVTNFDDEKGISVGILDGPTGVTNAVTRRIDDEVGGIDLCVGGVVLDPNATATYRSVVAVHDGGEAVPDRPRELIDAAAETG